MGYLSLDGYETEFDDRTLAHIHVVIIHKLSNGSSFALSWRDSQDQGNGRTSVWLHPGSNIRFQFAGSRAPSLNHQWLSLLAESADGSRGLIIVPEPEPLTPASEDHRTQPALAERHRSNSRTVETSKRAHAL